MENAAQLLWTQSIAQALTAAADLRFRARSAPEYVSVFLLAMAKQIEEAHKPIEKRAFL